VLFNDKNSTQQARLSARLQHAQLASQQRTTNKQNENKAARELQRAMTHASGAF